MTITYSNLNTKGHFSCGLGIGTSTEIIQAAKEAGLYSIALTDRCTAAGLLDFYNKGKELKFPVILGIETYVQYNTQLHRIILLAKNQEGYTSICKLVTLASLNKDAYKKPCITLYDLSDNKDGLVCITNELSISNQIAPFFGSDFYYELILDSSNIETNKIILSKYSNIVVSSDAFIPTASHKVLQDIMITNTAFGFSKEPFVETKNILSVRDIVMKVAVDHKYLEIDLLRLAFENTKNVSDQCTNVSLKFTDQIVNYPHLLHPLNHDSSSKEALLRRIIQSYGRMQDTQEYRDRLEYEIDSIKNNGRVDLTDYFLVLEDICRWCRENNIAVGPGRGSGAGSLINYCLKVTHLDPIKYGLLFERFISAGRIQKGNLPDVDIDFSQQEPVRQYLIEKYGDDRVIPIGTMQTLKAKGSIKDIFRSFHPELDFQYVQRICNALGEKDQEETELEFFERGLESEIVQKAFSEYPTVQQHVSRLLGYNRQPGVHPCGLAITQDPMREFVPLRFDKDRWVNELSANDCEKSGIIKYDILGLITLKYIQTCLELCGIKDLYSIPLDDDKTLKAFADGDTASVFQFNSDVSKNILKQIPLAKMSLDTLSMVTSVGRPGPMKNNQHNEFIKRVQGVRKSTSPHSALDNTLKDTYGIMIYQESVMKASEILGGFSLAESDDIRKAMGKKKASILVPYKKRFIEYCQQNYEDTNFDWKNDDGSTVTLAEHIWELMATFSGYGFNKSHSMSYALIGYYCQYLKVNYPLQWWTACMSHADKEKLRLYYAECSHLVNNPDINNSTAEFFITSDNKIQMPFTCVKGLGPKASEEIAAHKPYKDFNDFFARVNKAKVNKSVVEKLIFCGCFDSFRKSEQQLINDYYELRGEKIPEKFASVIKSDIDEHRAKGLSFLSMDYYAIYPKFFPSNEVVNFIDLVSGKKSVAIGGVIGKITKKKTKHNHEYCDFIVTNDGEDLSIRVWPEEYSFYKDVIEEKVVVKVIGNTSEYNGKLQFTATNISALTKG